jgi:hypothetical protein
VADRYPIDDPNDVIGRIFREASQDGWDAFRDMLWLLTEDPWPATSPVRNITLGMALGNDPPKMIAPFDGGRGLLMYWIETPRTIVPIEFVWVGD